MFKNKYLKQLQDVQRKITKCKDTILQLEPPKPDSIYVAINIQNWLDALTGCLNPDIDRLLSVKYPETEEDTYKYIHRLGEFFMNISDYYQKEKKYTDELQQLQAEERELKEKLGIY